MSTQTCDYVMWGIKQKFDEELNELLHDYMLDDIKIPDVIADGMSGEYMMLGKILRESPDLSSGGPGSLMLLDVSELPVLESEYRELFQQTFPDFVHLLDQPFRLIAFTHWS